MKKIKNFKHILIILLIGSSFSVLNAQENAEKLEIETATEDTTYNPIDFNLQVKNMHYLILRQN